MSLNLWHFSQHRLKYVRRTVKGSMDVVVFCRKLSAALYSVTVTAIPRLKPCEAATKFYSTSYHSLSLGLPLVHPGATSTLATSNCLLVVASGIPSFPHIPMICMHDYQLIHFVI
jgi:hypothetical protein